MPSYVNDVYVQRKLVHIDEQISAISHRKLAAPIGEADAGTASLEFQKERRDLLLWATTADDADVTKALLILERLGRPATVALETYGDLTGVPFESVQARAYWELITCVVTPPETVVNL